MILPLGTKRNKYTTSSQQSTESLFAGGSMLVLSIFTSTAFSLFASGRLSAAECHYQDWRWNVMQKRVVARTLVVKDYDALTAEERDQQSGCSVCIEDQREITIDGLAPFAVCRRYADKIESSLRSLIQQGAKIESVIGYRVGRTRGSIDSQGNRVGFSNHSYGIAIDINTSHNALYDNCIEYGPQCHLLRGGPWRPGRDPYSLTPDGEVVGELKRIGFKWGGEIAGRQKDFMHFSLSGY